MSKKSISINPNFLKIEKWKNPKKKRKKKQRPINTLKPNNVKKKLIEKIKAHQQREKEKELLAEEKEEREFQDNFKETLSYLQELDIKSKKKKKKKKKRDKTMKKSNIPINTQPMENPPTKFSHAPLHHMVVSRVVINLHLDSITKLLKKRKTKFLLTL